MAGKNAVAGFSGRVFFKLFFITFILSLAFSFVACSVEERSLEDIVGVKGNDSFSVEEIPALKENNTGVEVQAEISSYEEKARLSEERIKKLKKELEGKEIDFATVDLILDEYDYLRAVREKINSLKSGMEEKGDSASLNAEKEIWKEIKAMNDKADSLISEILEIDKQAELSEENMNRKRSLKEEYYNLLKTRRERMDGLLKLFVADFNKYKGLLKEREEREKGLEEILSEEIEFIDSIDASGDRKALLDKKREELAGVQEELESQGAVKELGDYADLMDNLLYDFGLDVASEKEYLEKKIETEGESEILIQNRQEMVSFGGGISGMREELAKLAVQWP